MENENFENDNSINIAETTENNETETLETETLSPEELKTLREKAAKADELEEKNKKLYERAKKAEAGKKEVKEDKVEGLTARDVLLLTGAGYTHEEDIETIEKWAKFNGVEIRDALKDSTLKTVLSAKAEERKTAQATATGGGARGVKTPTADSLIEEAKRGKLSEDNLDKLAEARMAKRKERLGN